MRRPMIWCFVLAGAFVALATLNARGSVSAVAAAPAPQSGEPDTKDWESLFPEGEGKSYVLALCQPCHDLKSTALGRHDIKGWRSVVAGMNSRGASMEKDEVALVSEYLAGSFGADRPMLDLPLDLNQADEAHLALFPELTPQDVGKVIEARSRKPFRSLADLKGALSDEKIAHIRPFVVVR